MLWFHIYTVCDPADRCRCDEGFHLVSVHGCLWWNYPEPILQVDPMQGCRAKLLCGLRYRCCSYDNLKPVGSTTRRKVFLLTSSDSCLIYLDWPGFKNGCHHRLQTFPPITHLYYRGSTPIFGDAKRISTDSRLSRFLFLVSWPNNN